MINSLYTESENIVKKKYFIEMLRDFNITSVSVIFTHFNKQMKRVKHKILISNLNSYCKHYLNVI